MKSDVKKTVKNRISQGSVEDKIFTKKYPAEKQGYKKIGIYKAGSTSLKWAVDRLKRDGYEVAGVNVTSDTHGTFTVLFRRNKGLKTLNSTKTKRKTTAKKSKAIKTTTGSTRSSVNMWHGLPEYKKIGEYRYHIVERYSEDEGDVAKDIAQDKRKAGYDARVLYLKNTGGEYKWCVYIRKKSSR